MKTIKSKISLGIGFLFAVIILLSVSGIIFINNLSLKSKGTIIENYTSVNYMMNMATSFDDMNKFQMKFIADPNNIDSIKILNYENSKKIFEKNLQLQTKTITEIGESELVNQLHEAYRNYLNSYEKLKSETKINEADLQLFEDDYLQLKNNIIDIHNLNMDAINLKINELQTTADDITMYMLALAIISVLISIWFMYVFPTKIIEPIKQLTGKIKLISEKNYDQKLDVNTKDELEELAKAFNIMSERLQLYNAKQIDELIFEQKRLAALVQSFEDGILFINENREVVIVNETILQITGLKEEEIINHNIQEVIKHNDLLREIYNYSIFAKTSGTAELKPIIVAKNEKELFFNLEKVEIITYSESEKKETFIGNLILLRNVTKFQQRDKAKTNLLATVSHELKTPLSSINMCLKLLNDNRLGELSGKHKEIIQTLKQQSSRLSRVINELLDYSQIETGNIKLKFTKEKPDTILDVGVTALLMQISEKNIDLQTEVEEYLPEIKIDLEKLVFVFINILVNAIRYSPAGGRIDIKIKRIINDVEFSIKDYGPGISDEDQEKLFQRFTQIDKNVKQGWGLGLAISKEFLTAQNGKIWVESKTGEGSKFIFTIPAFNK